MEQDIPRILQDAAELHEQKDELQERSLDLRERLDRLKRTIQNTRELANKIKVGVSFQPSTSLELKNPEDLTKATTSTKVSSGERRKYVNCGLNWISFVLSIGKN